MTIKSYANRRLLSADLLPQGSVASLWFSSHHFISNKSQLFIILQEDKFSLSVGLPLCPFNCPHGYKKAYQLSRDCLWPQLMQSGFLA
jgi:hypothetical protein